MHTSQARAFAVRIYIVGVVVLVCGCSKRDSTSNQIAAHLECTSGEHRTETSILIDRRDGTVLTSNYFPDILFRTLVFIDANRIYVGLMRDGRLHTTRYHDFEKLAKLSSAKVADAVLHIQLFSGSWAVIHPLYLEKYFGKKLATLRERLVSAGEQEYAGVKCAKYVERDGNSFHLFSPEDGIIRYGEISLEDDGKAITKHVGRPSKESLDILNYFRAYVKKNADTIKEDTERMAREVGIQGQAP